MTEEINKETMLDTFERGDSYIHRDDLEKLIQLLITQQEDIQDLQTRIIKLEQNVK